MTPLEDVLSGRDERAARQRELLERRSSPSFVCQIALNIPGYPKRMPRDKAAVENFLKRFLKEYGEGYIDGGYVENGAGVCWIGLFDDGGFEAFIAKGCAVAVEEAAAGGRAADIDVITRDGVISRSNIKRPQRKCIICGGDAKVCSREARHSVEELRAKTEALLKAVELS